MHRKFCALLFVFFVTVFAAFSQDSEWYWDQPISKIDFNGLKNVKKSELQGVTSSFIGQPFSADTYNEILDRLYSLDFFDDITPSVIFASKNASSLNEGAVDIRR